MRKIVKGFVKYEVDETGVIYNKKSGKTVSYEKHPGCRGIKSGSWKYTSYSYMAVKLYDNEGKRHTCKVHKIVAEAFLDKTSVNPDNTPMVGRIILNHKNHNTADNRVSNLEYCDYTYNNKH